MSQPKVYSNNKELKKIIKYAEKQGWRVLRTKSGHFKWYSPDGESIVTSPSTGSHKSWKNFMALLKKAGYVEQ